MVQAHLVGGFGAVMAALLLAATTTVLAWRPLASRPGTGAILLVSLIPCAAAIHGGGAPPLHAGLVGTAMLVAAAALMVRTDEVTPADRIKALAIAAGFAGLWTLEIQRGELNTTLALAPLVPVGMAALLTLTELLLRAKRSFPPTTAAWILSAGGWFSLSLAHLLV